MDWSSPLGLMMNLRFSTPSAGGWADCMVNFSLAADPDGHVCELQCVHGAAELVRVLES